MHNKCGRGANRGQKLLARCGQRTKIFCPRHLYLAPLLFGDGDDEPYCRNCLIALCCYTHFIWALMSVMIALKISVFCAKAEVERIQFASVFVCQFMWWLKFQYKHVTLVISCQVNRTVSLAVSGCFHVHFPTEELHLICLLAVIEEPDEFSKKYRWFFIYLTAQTSEPSVLAANFYKSIADFCISEIQFCCSCFSIKKKNHIYSTCSGKGKQYC